MSLTRYQKIARLSQIPEGIGSKYYETVKWTTDLNGKLPSHYKSFYFTWRLGPQIPIHYLPTPGKFIKDKFGLVQRVQNVPIPVIYPDEFHQGLWGGEGVIKGLKEPPKQRHYPNPRKPACAYWFPKLEKGVVYSEILEKHIEMLMTLRGRRLVDQHLGFDSYLLETPVNEIYAWDLLKIKREMLLKLADPKSDLKDEIREKYDRFKVEREEADWHGLRLHEAYDKVRRIEYLQNKSLKVPKKHEYRAELIELLQKGYLDDLDATILMQEEEEKYQKSFMGKASEKTSQIYNKLSNLSLPKSKK